MDTRRAIIERQAADSKWGSTLGLLYLDEHLTSPEMRAGFAYGRLRGQYDAIQGLPRRSTQAMCYHEARAGVGNEMPADELLRLKERHMHLLAYSGGARMLLDQVCCDDRPPAAGDILRLAVALRRLVTWFGMEAGS